MPNGYYKRTACQIAAQLPDDQTEALAVLSLVREIVMNLGVGWHGGGAREATQLFAVTPTSPEEFEANDRKAPSGPPDKANRA